MTTAALHDPTVWRSKEDGQFEKVCWRVLDEAAWQEADGDTQAIFTLCDDGRYRPMAKHWRDPRAVEAAASGLW